MNENEQDAYMIGLAAGSDDYRAEVREGSSALNPFKRGDELYQHFIMGYIDGFIE